MADAWAVIAPDGAVAWYPLAAVYREMQAKGVLTRKARDVY